MVSNYQTALPSLRIGYVRVVRDFIKPSIRSKLPWGHLCQVNTNLLIILIDDILRGSKKSLKMYHKLKSWVQSKLACWVVDILSWTWDMSALPSILALLSQVTFACGWHAGHIYSTANEELWLLPQSSYYQHYPSLIIRSGYICTLLS